MVDVDGIIGAFKEAVEKKEQEQQAKVQKRKQQLIINAKAVENCICTIIKPAFEEVREKIEENGFRCEIEPIRRTEVLSVPPQEYEIGVKIVIQTKPNGTMQYGSYLQYEGSFDAQDFTRSESIAGSGKSAEKLGPYPLDMVTDAKVGRDLDEFLRKVFKA